MSRINRLIQKEVSDLFRQQTQSLPGTLITVTSVTVSPDLSIARIRLSIFPSVLTLVRYAMTSGYGSASSYVSSPSSPSSSMTHSTT